MIKLTDWESGLPTYIDPQAIVVLRRLPAEVYSIPGADPIELGERTKVVAAGDTFLVREPPEDILTEAQP